MRTIEIRGVSFQVIGRPNRDKVPLLLINGMRMKQGVYNRLKRELKVPTISFDFPRLWWPLLWGELPLMKNIANKVSGLIHELGYEQVDLLGASWGGALAIEMAARHPQQIRNLVLVSTTARPFQNCRRPGMLGTYLRSDYGGKARHTSELQIDVDSKVGRSSLFTDAYRGCCLPLWGGSQKLPHIEHRTLIVSGHDDPITPAEEAKWLLNIPNSRLEMVDDGHLALYSSAKEVAQHINHFLVR